jgi:hypothetical protein
VKAGTFDTFKVNFGLYLEGRHLQDQKFWYSNDAHRYPVKMENIVTLELLQVTSGAQSGASLQDAAAGISLNAPGGWFLAPYVVSSATVNVKLYGPELRADGELSREALSKQNRDQTALQLAEEHMDWAQKQYKVYALRGKAPETFDLNGRTAARFVADFTHPVTGASMVEDQTFIAQDGNRVSLRFNVEKEQWDSLKPGLDAIVGSLRLK